MKSLFYKYNYKIILFSLVAIAPFYPSFFSLVYGNNTVYEFNRGNIDETSIIGAFLDEENNNYSNNSFLSIQASSNTKRNLSSTTEIINHVIKEGESFSSIANDFGISKESIYWANNLSSSSTLEIGKKIKIPPVTGLIYKVKSGDTISTLASEFKIDAEKIEKQNGLEDGKLINNAEIILPDAKKKVVIPPPVYTKTKTSSSSSGKTYARAAANKYVAPVSGGYELVRRAPQHTFYWGNCTRFVGQYKNVNWGGNANQWLRNARAKGHATGYQATPGAIIVFGGSSYNPRYGHVGIVKKVEGNQLVVVDMNFRRLNEITYRRISANDSAIRGYIYVN